MGGIGRREEFGERGITFFVPDSRREGGEYVSKKGVVTKVDNNRKIVIVDNESIDIENIIRIEFCE